MTFRTLVGSLAAVSFLVGCASDPAIPTPAPGQVIFLRQGRPLDEVLARTRDLREGMTEKDVLALLGRPAFVDPTGWDYVSHDVQGTPVFGPKCHRLHVTFVQGRFASFEVVQAPVTGQ